MNEIRIITEPGVYFDLPNEVYHASPGLSSSGIKNLLISPLNYWVDAVDPDRQRYDTEANIFGTAMHRRTLEGKSDFYQHYAIIPDRSVYPDAHFSKDHLKIMCRERGLIISGTIPELIERIVDEDHEIEIFEDIVDKFREANKDKIILSSSAGRDIEERHEIIDAHPDAQRAFCNGRPEVSVFWIDEEHGLFMKSRLDYVKPKALIDLKTFTNKRRVPVDKSIGMEVASYQYHVQAFVYKRAIEAAKKMLINDKPSEHILEYIRSPANSDFIEQLIECKNHTFWFAFIESGKAPNIRVRRFDKKGEDELTNAYWHAAEMGFNRGVEIYKQFKEAHPDPYTPWHEYVPATPFVDEDFPMYMLD